MQIELDEREVVALMRALDRYLPELEFELARIKLERHRHDLVELDHTLRRLRERLGAAGVEPTPGS
jgi:hypothetical protein